MIDPESLKFSQVQMATLAGVNKSTICRRITTEKIESIGGEAGTKKYSFESTRQILQHCRRSDTPLQKIHVFYNFKGGTGKSTLSSQFAYHLAVLGYNVLAIDLDPQAHMTLNLGIEAHSDDYLTMYDVLVAKEKIDDIIMRPYQGLDVIPSNLKLTRLEVPLSQHTRREEVLKRAILPLTEEYDFVIIDTNPTFSVLNVNALVAAHQINVVCATHPLSYHGLGLLVNDLEELFIDMNISTPYKILANLYESKTVTAQEILGALRAEYKEKVAQTVVRKSEDLNLASKLGQPVCYFAKKKSTALEDILDLTRELIEDSYKEFYKSKLGAQEKVQQTQNRMKTSVSLEMQDRVLS